MRKKIKKIGGVTLGITFSKEEREIYEIEVGDIIECNHIHIIRKAREKKDKGKIYKHKNIK